MKEVVLICASLALGVASWPPWPVLSRVEPAFARASAGRPWQDFSSARTTAASLPQLHSLVVGHRGDVVFEHYARGYRGTRQANIKSASKSIIAALVGIAIERKLIPGVEQPIVRWFPELRKDPDTRKRTITIEDLLTMRSGLESTSGGNEMSMTPRQMVAFGEMWLNEGRARGRQVVPEDWVDTSCKPRTRSRWDRDREYGYGWWSQEFGRHRACFAWGFGGQYIFVFDDLDLVVVVTSATDVSDERRGYRRRLFDLLEAHVLPRIEALR